MKYLFLILVLFSMTLLAQESESQEQEENLVFDYKTLELKPELFERKSLKLTGLISDLKRHKGYNGLEYTVFKLSKSSKVEKYLNVYIFKKFGEETFIDKEFDNGGIIEIEGEFRKNHEIVNKKHLGDLYVNKAYFTKKRIDFRNEKYSNGYLLPKVPGTIRTASIADMLLDVVEPDTEIIARVTGYVSKVEFKDEQNGRSYWDVYIKDHREEDTNPLSNFSLIVRYYMTMNGKEYADINMDDYYVRGQRVSFTGLYKYKEKEETNPIVGTLEMNYIDEKQKYHDYFVQRFNKVKSHFANIQSGN